MGHLLPRTLHGQGKSAYRRASAIVAKLSLAALLVTTQAEAQNPVLGGSASQSREGAAAQQVASGADTGLSLVPAPDPAQGEAGLPRLETDPFHSLEMAQNGGQSSSHDATQTPPATTSTAMTPAPKPRPTHHGLGVALAIVGTTALFAGVVLYEGEQHAWCNSSSTGCAEARDTGIALMPIGGAMAATGFYLVFHH